MENLPIKLKSSNQMRQVLGVTKQYFDIILRHFRALVSELHYENYYKRTKRSRIAGGGRKSILPSYEDKLAFCLYYLKNYPTFAVLAHTFDMGISTAYNNFKLYMPILRQSLVNLGVEPFRTIEDDEELSNYIKKKGFPPLL